MGRVTFHYEGARIEVSAPGIAKADEARECLQDYLDSMESDD